MSRHSLDQCEIFRLFDQCMLCIPDPPAQDPCTSQSQTHFFFGTSSFKQLRFHGRKARDDVSKRSAEVVCFSASKCSEFYLVFETKSNIVLV